MVTQQQFQQKCQATERQDFYEYPCAGEKHLELVKKAQLRSQNL